MNIVDAGLIFIIIIGAVVGIKQGFIRSIVGLFGSLLVFFLSWILKGSLAIVLINNLPEIGANPAVSILIYHVTSFLVLLIVLTLILKLVLKLTKIIEKILDATIILGFVSRILGGLVGAIKTYIILFFVLFILSIFNISLLNNSKVNNFILEKTPGFTPLVRNTWNSIKSVYESKNVEESIKVLFENNIINEENMNKLLKEGE